MEQNLKIIKKIENDRICFVLDGDIDEDASLDEMIVHGVSEIRFDLKNIKMINSCGIRSWVEFQGQLDDDVKIIYQNCPQVIIEQMNMIKGFIKDGGEIESFYAPYFNPSTDEEVKILITPKDVTNQKAPKQKDQNGNELEFDDIEQHYFSFLVRK